MKKTISFILAAMLLLVGCSTKESDNKWKPQRVSENIKPYAEKALNIVEQYLAFDISLEEFYADISDIHDRIDYEDGEDHNTADLAVLSAISDLYFSYDEYSDRTFRLYRDILRFQLGQSVKKETYSAAKTLYAFDEESERIGKQLKLQELPMFESSVYVLDSSPVPTILLYFDLANGITPEDVFTHYKTILGLAKQHDICLDDLIIYYRVYGQIVFTIDLRLEDSGEYTLSLGFDASATAVREYIEPTDANIQKMIIAATAYVSDYVK